MKYLIILIFILGCSTPPKQIESTIVGDFDGDGVQDRAGIFLKSEQYSLLVWLNRSQTPLTLSIEKEPGSIHSIKLRKPGTVSQSVPEDLRSPTLHLKTDGIEYSYSGEFLGRNWGSALFYWDKSTHDFKSYSLSWDYE